MDNQNVRSFSDQGSLAQIDLSIATVTLIITDYLPFNLLWKGLVDRFDILDIQRKEIEIFLTIFDFSTLGTDHLLAVFAAENRLCEIFPGGWFESTFKSIEENSQEFWGILLFNNICWWSIKFFECKTEPERVVFISRWKFEMCNQSLHLMKHVIINLVSLILNKLFTLSIVNTQQVVPEGRNHEELLHHRVHVTNAAQISETHIQLTLFCSS